MSVFAFISVYGPPNVPVALGDRKGTGSLGTGVRTVVNARNLEASQEQQVLPL